MWGRRSGDYDSDGGWRGVLSSRHPVAEVYARIEDDLNAAAGYIRTNAKGCYYATADNVNLLRSDFALWMYAAGGGDGYLTMAENGFRLAGCKSAYCSTGSPM